MQGSPRFAILRRRGGIRLARCIAVFGWALVAKLSVAGARTRAVASSRIIVRTRVWQGRRVLREQAALIWLRSGIRLDDADIRCRRAGGLDQARLVASLDQARLVGGLDQARRIGRNR